MIVRPERTEMMPKPVDMLTSAEAESLRARVDLSDVERWRLRMFDKYAKDPHAPWPCPEAFRLLPDGSK